MVFFISKTLYLGKFYSVAEQTVVVAFDDRDFATFSHYDARCALCNDKVIPKKYKDLIQDNIFCLENHNMALTLNKGTIANAKNIVDKHRKDRLNATFEG